MRVASRLFRLWAVFSVLWLAAAGACIVAAYQDVEAPDLKNGHLFDYLVPPYEYCWDYRTSDGEKVDRKYFSDAVLALIAECERTVDRRQILKTGIPVALGILLIVLCVGWNLVWAFRGFLPARP